MRHIIEDALAGIALAILTLMITGLSCAAMLYVETNPSLPPVTGRVASVYIGCFGLICVAFLWRAFAERPRRRIKIAPVTQFMPTAFEPDPLPEDQPGACGGGDCACNLPKAEVLPEQCNPYEAYMEAYTKLWRLEHQRLDDTDETEFLRTQCAHWWPQLTAQQQWQADMARADVWKSF